MKKILFTLMAAMIAASSFSQTKENQGDHRWKIGVTAGYTNNSYQMSSSYQDDWQLSSRGGATAGLSGQYNFNKWLGVRADLLWIQKDYCRKRVLVYDECKYTNNYLQLPVMASFSFGGEKLRGFFNAGFYGGYWISSIVNVDAENLMTDKSISSSQGDMINGNRDNRFVFGYVGGAGIEYQFKPRWSVQLELRYYYDGTSQVKQYQRISDHRYNSTIAIQAGMFYHF